MVSATNGKTTTTAMAAEILEPGRRLAWNRSGANLVSGVASTLLAERDADLGLLEVDEGALPEVVRRIKPRAVLLGNLFRDQLDRYGELEHIAERWRAATAALPPETVLVVNGDDPQVGDLARERSSAIAYGIDDPRHARPALQHAADSRYCVRCGQPYEFAAAYVGHLGDYRCPGCGHARPELQVRATEIELDGLHAASFLLETPAGATRLRLPLPGLYNVYNALGAAALAQSLGASLEEIRAGLERFGAAFGRFERIPAGRQDGAHPPDQESRRRERGRAHAARGRRPLAPARRAERRDRGREGRLLDLGRRLRAAARPLGAADRLRRPGCRAGPAVRLRRAARGRRSRWSRRSAARSTGGSS